MWGNGLGTRHSATARFGLIDSSLLPAWPLVRSVGLSFDRLMGVTEMCVDNNRHVLKPPQSDPSPEQANRLML